MPGTILKILVEANQYIEAGQAVVIMESMKMEMTLTASITGTIQKICCSAGQLVEMKSTLVQIQSEKTS